MIRMVIDLHRLGSEAVLLILLPSEAEARDVLRALKAFKRREFRRACHWMGQPGGRGEFPTPLSMTPAQGASRILSQRPKEVEEQLRDLPQGRPPLPDPVCFEEVMACAPGSYA